MIRPAPRRAHRAGWSPSTPERIRRQPQLAAQADVALAFGYQRMGDLSDLANLRLQGNGDALVQAAEAATPNTVVVLQTGSAVEMPWLDDVRAVLETWLGGEQPGPANRVPGVRRHRPARQAPDDLPEVARRRADAHARAVPDIFADGSTTRQRGSNGSAR